VKTQRRTNEKPARAAQVIAFALPLLFLLPFLSQTSSAPQVYSGLSLLSSNPALIQVFPMFVFACAALLLGVVLSFNKRKSFLYALAAAFSGAVITGIYALLTAKRMSDAAGILAAPFMVSDLSIAFWLFLLVSICGLTASLMAVRNPATYIVLTGMAVIWLLPILWLVTTSFRAEPGAYTTYIMPKGYTLSNYSRLFTETTQFSFPRWYLNTLIVAVFTCAITTMLVLMISFAFSRLRFTSRKLYMNVGLILSMFPGFMSMIAVYHILKAVGLDKSLVSLILVYSGGGALGYFIAKGFFDTIPRSLDEAATIDGASKNMIFWKIILPSSTPIIVFTAITAFIAPWVDFIFVSVIMKDDYQNYTIALGLFRMLEREFIYDYFTRFCAGAVLVAVPIMLLFIKIQKFYVEGVTGGAVKG
jgi:arabinogalactan oligomer/maltooligosaccharide transport system permease protein